MSRANFSPEYFKIKELKSNTGISKFMKEFKFPVTFNQIMKIESKIHYIFVFNENSVEIPLLLTFCHYFKIKIFKICKDEAEEIKKMIKHAQLVCVTSEFARFEEFELNLKNKIEKECEEKSIIENLNQIFI